MDLNTTLTQEHWTEICKNTFSMTSNNNLQLIQYKVIHRTHLTRYKMQKMGLIDTATCTVCTMGLTDTYLHALWECSPVQAFWNTVTQNLSYILNCRVPLIPSLCLLGLTTDTSIPPRHKNSLLTSLAIAKKTILQNWKSKHEVNINQWTNSLNQFITSSLIAACHDDDITPFTNSWTPFINYYNIDLNHFSPPMTT